MRNIKMILFFILIFLIRIRYLYGNMFNRHVAFGLK